MHTPEIRHNTWSTVKEHLKSPAEFLAYTALALVAILAVENLALPALNNFIEFANQALGK